MPELDNLIYSSLYLCFRIFFHVLFEKRYFGNIVLGALLFFGSFTTMANNPRRQTMVRVMSLGRSLSFPVNSHFAPPEDFVFGKKK